MISEQKLLAMKEEERLKVLEELGGNKENYAKQADTEDKVTFILGVQRAKADQDATKKATDQANLKAQADAAPKKEEVKPTEVEAAEMAKEIEAKPETEQTSKEKLFAINNGLTSGKRKDPAYKIVTDIFGNKALKIIRD